jgi:hypothetical protein
LVKAGSGVIELNAGASQDLIENAAPGSTIKLETVTVAANSTVTVPKDVTLEVTGKLDVASGAKLEVPQGAAVKVPTGAALEVAAGATVEVASGATVEVAKGATLDVAGTLDVKAGADIAVTGTLKTSSTDEAGNGVNNGTITIKEGGKAYSDGGRLDGTGYIVVEAGGEAYNRVTVGEETFDLLAIGNTKDTGALIQLTEVGAKVSFNNDGYTLEGKATLNGLQGAPPSTTGSQNKAYWFIPGTTLKLAKGSVLTIAKKSALVIALDGKAPLVTQDDSKGSGANAQIVISKKDDSSDTFTGIHFFTYVADGSHTWIMSGNVPDNTSNNFYQSGGSNKVTANPLTSSTSAASTYTWTTELDSGTDKVSGWVKQTAP